MTIGRPEGAPSKDARASVVVLVGTLISIYVISQLLRNSIGVIAPDLAAELALSPPELGLLSSVFFFTFAIAQIPVGMALDRFGARKLLLACVAATLVGILLFAAASSATNLTLARALLGLGVTSFLVAPLSIYARRFPPHQFAMLASLQYGIGTTGTLLATAPLAFLATAVGWRGSFLLIALLTFLSGILIAIVVREDDRWHAKPESLRESLAGILAVLRAPSIGPVFAINLVFYSSFVLVVGLWGGPYLTHVYGYGLEQRGALLVIPVIAHIVGALLWGTMNRVMGGNKRPVLLGAGLTAAAFGYLAAVGKPSPLGIAVWLAVFGFVSAYVPLAVAHNRALFPLALMGRGLTILNMGSMGGTFLVQLVSGIVIGLFAPAPDGAYPLAAYQTVFGLQAAFILLACLAYSRAAEPAAESATKVRPAPSA